MVFMFLTTKSLMTGNSLNASQLFDKLCFFPKKQIETWIKLIIHLQMVVEQLLLEFAAQQSRGL